MANKKTPVKVAKQFNKTREYIDPKTGNKLDKPKGNIIEEKETIDINNIPEAPKQEVKSGGLEDKLTQKIEEKINGIIDKKIDDILNKIL